MKKILIFGAGSIGNHMTNAALILGYEIYITDKSSSALTRMKEEVFKKRYGYWSEKINIIKLNLVKSLSKITFDLIIIGTPPSSHLKILKFCQKELKYKKILVEKPLCVYNQKVNKELFKHNNIFCGYNHSISQSFLYFLNIIKKNKRQIHFINVKWKEGWTGILNAHYWLKNEFSSYLGNIEEGGGSIHLAVYILDQLSNDKKIKCKKNFLNFKYSANKKIKYDSFASLNLSSEKYRINLEIDLLEPGANKEIIIHLDNKSIKWKHNHNKDADAVILFERGKSKILKIFKKDRPTEFVEELKHLKKINNKNKYLKSPLNIYYANQVMDVIRGAINEK